MIINMVHIWTIDRTMHALVPISDCSKSLPPTLQKLLLHLWQNCYCSAQLLTDNLHKHICSPG